MSETPVPRAEPRWPAILAALSVGGLYWALPEALTPGPGWLALALVVPLSTLAMVLQWQRRFRLNQIVGYSVLIVITAALIGALALLILALLDHSEKPGQLLRSAVALWISNVLVFASWYWRLDAGGPHARHLRESHTRGDFLFPQMTLAPDTQLPLDPDWSPGFVDYLFLAFNTSTAFSPTDSPVLSRWAKVLMMIQSSISLATLALLAARAVNIL
jgi:hypothetical protein